MLFFIGDYRMAPEATVLINTEIGSESDVLKELKKIGNITEAEALYGVYDIRVRIRGKTMDELNETVTWKIRQLDKVRSTLKLTAIEDDSFIRDDLLPANSPELKAPEQCAYRKGREYLDIKVEKGQPAMRKALDSLGSTRMGGAAFNDFISGMEGLQPNAEGTLRYCSDVCKLFSCSLNDHKDNPKYK